MKNRLASLAFVAAAVAVVPLTVGIVNAQTSQAARVNYKSLFLDKLAVSLGVDRAKLTSSLESASTDTINEALKNQDITRTEAARMQQAIKSGQFGFLGGAWQNRQPVMAQGFSRSGAPGTAMMGFGMAFRQPEMDAAAKALGLSTVDLESQLRAGQTLTDIAKAKGVPLKSVQDAELTAFKTQLDQAVAAGRMTQAQADQIFARAQQDPNFGLFTMHARIGHTSLPRR